MLTRYLPPHVLKVAIATTTIIGLVIWAATAPRGVETGTLTFDTEPQTEVYLGETRLGGTPITNLPLPVGPHHLRVRNKNANVDQEIEVQIKHNQLTSKRLRL